MARKLLKIAGVCGILGPIIAFTCIGAAIYYSPWFSWTENWLSDLGGIVGETPIWAARGIASVIFNVGLTISGIIGIVFAIAVRKSGMLHTRLGRSGTLLLLLDMSALCAVGIFPETTGILHVVASSAFFFLVPLSLIPIGATIRESEKTLGWLTILLGAISLSSLPLLLAPQPWGGNAIAEMFPSVSLAVFALVFGIRLLKVGLGGANTGTAGEI